MQKHYCKIKPGNRVVVVLELSLQIHKVLRKQVFQVMPIFKVRLHCTLTY